MPYTKIKKLIFFNHLEGIRAKTGLSWLLIRCGGCLEQHLSF